MESNIIRLQDDNAERLREDAVIADALAILGRRVRRGALLSSPATVKKYLVCAFGARLSEVFSVLWLDGKNRLIVHDVLFHGTLSQLSEYQLRF